MTEYSKRNIKRIISDIKEINTNPLTDSGIYYKHDESEMFKGYILFCPFDETPYQYGFYIFEILFPYNYPDSPLNYYIKQIMEQPDFIQIFIETGRCV